MSKKICLSRLRLVSSKEPQCLFQAGADRPGQGDGNRGDPGRPTPRHGYLPGYRRDGQVTKEWAGT